MIGLRGAAAALGATILLSPAGWDQTGGDESGLQERAESGGFKAESVFEVGEIDTVNLFNGNLTLNIPIGQEYGANGNIGYSLVLSYNSNVWDLREEPWPNVLPCGPKGRCQSGGSSPGRGS